jgi:hypothetical protein
MSDPIQPVSSPTPPQPVPEQAPPPPTEAETNQSPPPTDETVATRVDVTA